MVYRGLKFRPSIRNPGALDVWDKDREQWFYTAMTSNKKELDYYLTEQPGRWDRSMDVLLFDLKTAAVAGSLKFLY
ncbi:hypothetical protein LCGC14_0976580 [marine sediment metagenome]|uniref:Uncharacterized protein n=1 Tax=marine sediment metagenome TaxID=412755 RepID=A0A0F9RGJ6_9ZZZZ